MGESGKHHPTPENTKLCVLPSYECVPCKLCANLGCWFYSDSSENLTEHSETKSRARLEKSNKQVLAQGETENMFPVPKDFKVTGINKPSLGY